MDYFNNIWCLHLSFSFQNLFLLPISHKTREGSFKLLPNFTWLHNTAFLFVLKAGCVWTAQWLETGRFANRSSTSTPIVPPSPPTISVQFSAKQLSSCWDMHNLELAGTVEPEVRLFVCFFILRKWNCQLFYVFLWMIAILAAWEIPPTKDITMESRTWPPNEEKCDFIKAWVAAH